MFAEAYPESKFRIDSFIKIRFTEREKNERRVLIKKNIQLKMRKLSEK